MNFVLINWNYSSQNVLFLNYKKEKKTKKGRAAFRLETLQVEEAGFFAHSLLHSCGADYNYKASYPH